MLVLLHLKDMANILRGNFTRIAASFGSLPSRPQDFKLSMRE